jgi:hypothetical protein
MARPTPILITFLFRLGSEGTTFQMINTHRALRAASILIAGAVGVIVVAACSSSRASYAGPPPDLGIIPEADGSTPPPEPMTCALHCSRDLKQVLAGCEGAETVAQQCNQDQGCGGDTCVDACTAVSLSKGSVGCDFWAAEPDDPRSDAVGGCFAALIANTWDRPVAISADFGPSPLDISHSIYTVDRTGTTPSYNLLQGALPAGQVAVIFLAHDDAKHGQDAARCPATVTPAMLVDAVVHGTAKSTAFHIKTDAPISAYAMYPYGGAESFHPTATLLLPSSSWEKNYIAISPFDFGSTGARRTLQFVASEDDTDVTMLPTVEVASSASVPGTPPGVVASWKLSKGQVLQFLQRDLTGSVIETSKPIGMFGGSECTMLPTSFCDMLQQQIPPVSQWGTEYAVVPFRPRIDSFSSDVREQVPYTIVAGANGTKLTYEPSRPQNAPETLNAGQSAAFITEQLFVVKSQDSKHPFQVNVYMTGALYGGGSATELTTLGDPDFVNVPPAGQYLDRYVFFTDFTYQETSLTVVRRKTAKGFMPVTLECAGEITTFQPLGSSGEYEYAWVELTRGFLPQKFAKGECSYGRQEAHSDGPFAVTVWGVDLYASYGYVGGTGLRPINDAEPPTVR